MKRAWSDAIKECRGLIRGTTGELVWDITNGLRSWQDWAIERTVRSALQPVDERGTPNHRCWSD